ncbi:MAG: HAD hydrolase family protein [Erysipelothrix sp.]|nr:HAD hydrolase family protein [Erysipelothrix sp.]
MLYQVICFDIDGTLINPRTNTIDPSTKQVLHKLKQRGFKLGIVTGRAWGAVKDEGIHELADWDYYVLNNGQRVLNKEFETVYEQVIEPEVMIDLIRLANKQEYGLLGQGDNWTLYTPVYDTVRKVHTDLAGNIPTPQTYNNEKIFTLMGYGTDHSLFDEFPEFQLIPGIHEYVDIIFSDANKYDGLKRVISEPYVAFGDSLNDIEFLQHAAISIAMKDARDELKAIADYVSQQEDNEILTICEHFNWFES